MKSRYKPLSMVKITIALLSFALFFSQSAFASTRRVPEGYKSIQQAVDAAAPDDIIVVGPGSYSENVNIKKPVQLRSARGAEATIVTAAVKTTPVFNLDHAANVVVSGFTATGSNISGFTLRSVEGCRIIGNRAIKNGSGMLVYASKGNFITGNAADSNIQYGIYLEGSQDNNVIDNSADLNGDTGIFLSSSHANVLKGNSADINTWNGILLFSSHRNIVSGNKALRNAFSIVRSDSDDSDIDDNTTYPNFVIVLPIILIYAGVVLYLIQKNLLRMIYKV